jgi:hypothetical protein
VLEFLLIAIVILLFAGTLVPEVNEPNYLAKARHYWDPTWCGQDFFLQSADTHTFFYICFGWLTLWLPLPAVAWLGRVITCGLLAYGWQQLSRAVSPRPALAVASAAGMLALNSFFQVSGEWVAGGFEAKGIAYGFIFWALANILKNRWNRGWILLGIASAFHVLVGGWACVAATIGWLLLGSHSNRPTLRSQIPAIFINILISLLGIWPAKNHDYGATIAEIVHGAEIHVFFRLGHHLDPGQFFFADQAPYLTPFAIRFLALAAVWAVLAIKQRSKLPLRRLDAFTFGALAVAAIGITISLCTAGNPPLAARLLRFYWFRLADVILPASVALAVVGRIPPLLQSRRAFTRSAIVGATLLLLLLPVCGQYLAAGVPAADRKFTRTASRWRDWQAMCNHARTQTPTDAIFLTPKYAHTFKWYAQRGEVATWKEVPQDARSAIAWQDRIERIHPTSPGGPIPLAERSKEDLLDLARRYGAGYLVTQAEPAIDLPIIYRNDSFTIYRLGEEAEGR